MSYRCCIHCEDDPIHDVEVNGHEIACTDDFCREGNKWDDD